MASLWRVSDEATAEFMAAFYKAMERGKMTPVVALRKAQLEMRKRDTTCARIHEIPPVRVVGKMATRVSSIIGTVYKSVTARPEYTITLFQVGLDNLEIEVDERVEAIQQVNAGLLEERQGAAIVVHYDKPLIVSESLRTVRLGAMP